MRDDAPNPKPRQDPEQEKEVLKFHFTPVAAPHGKVETNPHAKQTTQVADVIEALREALGEAVGETVVYAGEHTVYVEREQIVEVCRFLKEEQGFNYFSDLGTIDRFTEEDRFEVFYNLVSIQGRKRIRVKVRTDEGMPVPSVTGLYRAAMWHEREAWDMMGIHFDGHPDLRRMFMPEDFEHFPKRKEFPTLGIPGSLPLPPQHTGGTLTADPFARAHGDVPTD